MRRLKSDTKLDRGSRILLEDENGNHYVGFVAPAGLSDDQVWVLPEEDGINGESLQTDGSGNLSFGSSSGEVTVAHLANENSRMKPSYYGQQCVIMSDGTVRCWGINGNGQLGDGSSTNRAFPNTVPLPQDEEVSQVYPVNRSAYALMKDTGKVYAWGNNNNGQLGDGTTTQRYTPVRVGTLTDVDFLEASGYNSGNNAVAKTSAGRVWGWGYNGQGQLGDGTTTERHSPVAMLYEDGGTGTTITDAEEVSVGFGNGVNCVLRNDSGNHSVWCTGYNGQGAVGDGTNTNRSKATQVVKADNSKLTGIKQIVVGGGYSSASYPYVLALTISGDVYAWGYNAYGQLGTGDTINYNKAQHIMSNVKEIYATVNNGGSSYALMTDGTVKAWGNNNNGQLGDGTTTRRYTPVTVGTLSNIKKIVPLSSGYNSNNVTVGALTTGGEVYTWGNAENGQAGDGNTANHNVTSPYKLNLKDIVDLTGTGYTNYKSFIARNSKGQLWSWGYNGQGSCGVGTTINQFVPSDVRK